MDADVILAALGYTSIVNLAWITKPLRRFKLFRCSMCTGLWFGAALTYLDSGLTTNIILNAGIASVASYTWYLLMKYFIEKYD